MNINFSLSGYFHTEPTIATLQAVAIRWLSAVGPRDAHPELQINYHQTDVKRDCWQHTRSDEET